MEYGKWLSCSGCSLLKLGTHLHKNVAPPPSCWKNILDMMVASPNRRLTVHARSHNPKTTLYQQIKVCEESAASGTRGFVKLLCCRSAAIMDWLYNSITATSDHELCAVQVTAAVLCFFFFFFALTHQIKGSLWWGLKPWGPQRAP